MFLEETKENIRKQFAVFTEKFERAGKEIEARIHAEPADVALLLKYLYANMPFSDVADYPYEMFREFAAHGAQLRKEQIWKGETRIPDEIFLDNVVFHRVNTEGITSCRPLFYEQLQERVAGKQMEAAILETNYWCAEEATYQATDDRTISAEAVYRNGIGRCGEESVFTVNALRSIGSRQGRYMRTAGHIAMTIMPGSKYGVKERGIFWEPVSRKRFWIWDGSSMHLPAP